MRKTTGIFAAVAASAFFCADNLCAQLCTYPVPLSDYPDSSGLWNTIATRAETVPFNIFATLVFLCAVVHTFCHRYFLEKSEHLKRLQRIATSLREHDGEFVRAGQKYPVSFAAKFYHLMGEVEAIFALWLIPLFAGFWLAYGWDNFTAYLDRLTFGDKKFVEPAFVIVVMCIAETRPIIQISADVIGIFAKLAGGGVRAWWFAVLTVGPLLGSFITEPAAITICATLLAEKFFVHNPSEKFRYATLGVLLVAISAGGTLTHFSAPPVLMVAGIWNWDMPFMLANFGWKAALAIAGAVALYGFAFRREFSELQARNDIRNVKSSEQERVPFKIVAVHVGFLIFTVHSLHHPALFIFAFLLFLAFVEATSHFQFEMKLKTPLLVGLFLAALVAHGSLQGWWIDPVLTSFGRNELFFGSIVLSAFNDNAAITYLASLVPDFSDAMKYTVVAGAVAGGGLTVIANAPNPAGIAILKKYFISGVSPKRLLVAALAPTTILAAAFYLL